MTSCARCSLLGDHQERDAVLDIVGKLVARTTDLERQPARTAAQFKVTEKVSTAQLVLFVDPLRRADGEPDTKRNDGAEGRSSR